jgi:hypothetical protein
MIDFWQAVILSLASVSVGGLITLVVSYATHRWTTTAARGAEERQTTRTVQEEERQARRQYRRERMKPVLDFLEVAKRCAGEEGVIDLMRQAYDKTSAAQTLPMTWEEFERVARRDWSVPDFYRLYRAFSVAVATAPTQEVELALMKVIQVLLPLSQQQKAGVSGRDWTKEANEAITSAEQEAERYLVEV